MMCITLRILAGASYPDVGWPYGVGVFTVYSIVEETLNAFDDALPKMKFPVTTEQCEQSSQQFQTNRHSPISGVISALDGIAIEIIQLDLRAVPNPRKYYNRKGFYAICVQAAVTADYKFVFVSARHAGGTHDSTAFQATKLYDKVLKAGKLPQWAIIVADDAYSNGYNIMTPYSGHNLSRAQDGFNYYLSSCRITVEQAFGMLVCRFGVFWSALRFGLSKDTLIIMVACKLHNFIINPGENEYATLCEAEQNNVRGSPVVHLQNTLHTEQAVHRSRQRSRDNTAGRDAIANHLHALGYTRPRFQRRQ